MKQIRQIESELEDYYRHSLNSHGPGARGVGWKSKEAQEVRFDQLAKIFGNDRNFTVNDLGCGVGDFFAYLASKNFDDFRYTGYDMLDKMLNLAKETYRGMKNAHWQKVNGSEDLSLADYTVASGIFNLKYNTTESDWVAYILSTLNDMNKNSAKGFAFNMLTKYSDPPLMKTELYYSDPLYFFDYCKKNFSKNIALLHDYYEFDFTILVKK